MSQSYGRHLEYPFAVGCDGRSRQVTALTEHVRQELLQLILTNPGERPFLPEFGGGIRRMIFEGASDASAALTKATLTDAVNRWLSKRIVLEKLDVAVSAATIAVELQYRLAGSDLSQIMRFERRRG
jgi:hypothetical protein